MSQSLNKPMVMRRKEVKAYGTSKAIEGVWSAGAKCLVIEDLVTSGLSVFETIDPLCAEGMQVKDVVVLVDRQQGGRKSIEGKGVVEGMRRGAARRGVRAHAYAYLRVANEKIRVRNDNPFAPSSAAFPSMCCVCMCVLARAPACVHVNACLQARA